MEVLAGQVILTLNYFSLPKITFIFVINVYTHQCNQIILSLLCCHKSNVSQSATLHPATWACIPPSLSNNERLSYILAHISSFLVAMDCAASPSDSHAQALCPDWLAQACVLLTLAHSFSGKCCWCGLEWMHQCQCHASPLGWSILLLLSSLVGMSAVLLV